MKSKILYEDRDVIVVHKPAGFPTQTARVGQADLVSELTNHLASKGEGTYVGVVHRLDQPVEGLLVFGKNKAATANLSKQLQTGMLNKHYYALCCGQAVDTEGTLVDMMIKTKDNMARIVAKEASQEKPQKAILHYKDISQEPRGPYVEFLGDRSGDEGSMCLLDVEIETGRFHQIRCQLSHQGTPILGDQKYGNETSLELSRALGIRNVALCAYRVEFKHPGTGKTMNYTI